jgi:hypothetical protein
LRSNLGQTDGKYNTQMKKWFEIHFASIFIITTNKSPSEWSKMLDDEVLATALLDRLLYHCDIINLSGKSYRMENRKTFFDHHK